MSDWWTWLALPVGLVVAAYVLWCATTVTGVYAWAMDPFSRFVGNAAVWAMVGVSIWGVCSLSHFLFTGA